MSWFPVFGAGCHVAARMLSMGALLFTCLLANSAAQAEEAWIKESDLTARELDERLAETEQQIKASVSEAATQDADEVSPAAFVPDATTVPMTSIADEDEKSELEQKFDDLSKKFDSLTAKDKDSGKKETFPNAKITGFTQLDSGWYSQTPKNIATVGDAQDGTEFRRARFAVVGKVAVHTYYQLEVDFATAGRPSFFDNYIEQTELPFFGTIRVGQYLQPFSVDAMSGFRNLPFLERSLPFLAFVPFRRVGAMAYNSTEDERTWWAFSGFRTGGFNNAPLGDSRFATDFGDIGGYSFSGRITHLLHYDTDCNLWHVGGGYNYSQLGANDAVGSGTPGNAGSPLPFYQARTAPEFGYLGYPENSSNFGSAVNGTPSFVDTGRYAAHNFNLFGLETVYQCGPFSFQSEWMSTLVNSVAGPVYYNGAYGEVMYRLTGEHRVYDKRLGALKNPVPFHDFISFAGDSAGVRGMGAWEVAARWSFVDLRNPSTLNGHYYDSVTNSFTGSSNAGNGYLNDATLGLTWFINKHTKLQFNWICALLNNTAKGYSSAQIYATRLQVEF